jgi:hypothetical protein
MKIAPTLADVIDGLRPRDRQDISRVGRVIREYRALLAVARAAKRCADDYDEEPYGIHRALSRLEKVSKP